MQLFGKIKTVHDLEYIVKTYVYIPLANEEIDVEELELLLKKKNKNVVGTIFLYNPYTAPIGYKKGEKLAYQDFKFDDKFHPLQLEDQVRIIAKAIKQQFKGKLVEVKYLFNYNKEDIQPTSAIEVFEMDLEKLNTNQLTVFAKTDNYHNYKNISYNGKFIFFAWGHKFDKSHTNSSLYASNIALWAKKQNKEIGFVYDGVRDEEGSFEYTRFFQPINFGKLKTLVPEAINKVFAREIIKPQKI